MTSRTLVPAAIDDVTRMRIDRATGLLLSSHSTKTADGVVLAEENVRRLP